MLYRLRPPAVLEWCDLPGRSALEIAAENNADLDRLPWEPTENRVFSYDLLRIALRHGVATKTGLVLDATDAANLGWADDIRLAQHQTDEAQAKLRATHGALMERLMPGWTEAHEHLNSHVRESTARATQKADAGFAEDLAAPVKAALLNHWANLGGSVPD